MMNNMMSMRLQRLGPGIRPLVSSVWLHTVSLLLGLGLMSCVEPGEPVLIEPVLIEPVWSESGLLDSVVVDSTRDESSLRRLAIYLDLSIPMAGFVPLQRVRDGEGVAGGELHIVAQLVPDHLRRAYPGVPIQWRGVAGNVRALPQNTIVRRDIFTGTESRLDLAIGEIIADLRAGRTKGGALITDLLGTGENTGAAAVASHLIPWLNSAERRAGDFHFGLIGVRGTYWGAFHRTRCPHASGKFGCWYSERMPGWKPRLSTQISVPFYVLLFGRSAEKINMVAESISRDAESVLKNARSREIGADLDAGVEDSARVAWELLTASESRDTIFFNNSSEYSLRRYNDKTYRCFIGDMVALRGAFGDRSRFNLTRVALAPGSGGTPSPFTVERDGDSLEVRVDCGAIRTLDSNPALRLIIDGTMRPIRDWEHWSTPNDDTPEHPGKTLQLIYFVEDTRTEPAYYRIDLPVLTAGQS